MSRAITVPTSISIAFSTAVFATTVESTVEPLRNTVRTDCAVPRDLRSTGYQALPRPGIDNELSKRYLEHYIEQLDSTQELFFAVRYR